LASIKFYFCSPVDFFGGAARVKSMETMCSVSIILNEFPSAKSAA
jgi:hypothetical protein